MKEDGIIKGGGMRRRRRRRRRNKGRREEERENGTWTLTPLCTVSNSASISGLSKYQHIIVRSKLASLSKLPGSRLSKYQQSIVRRTKCHHHCQPNIALLVQITRFSHHCLSLKIALLVRDVSANSFCTISCSYDPSQTQHQKNFKDTFIRQRPSLQY